MASETTGTEHISEGAHAAGSIAEKFPPFDASTFTSQLFWLAITFILLYVFLSRIFLPKIGNVIEERKGKIASDIDDAARMKAEADESLVTADKQLAAARAEARAKADKTRGEIDAKISEASAAKAAELDEKLAEAEVRIGQLKASAMSNVSDIATQTTSAILAQLGTTASDADIAAAVKKSVDEVVA
ncbi:MAG: ATP F0F1 synthase subunit B' [Ponticaulis sp.]|nr:ATP F0F1 synthase subunit B' [Ponticaulis sp.]|tara:strand:+ start:28052 stop:28615 length:564 start_codon:yes stop_codon:yes gene_type:complete